MTTEVPPAQPAAKTRKSMNFQTTQRKTAGLDKSNHTNGITLATRRLQNTTTAKLNKKVSLSYLQLTVPLGPIEKKNKLTHSIADDDGKKFCSKE